MKSTELRLPLDAVDQTGKLQPIVRSSNMSIYDARPKIIQGI